MTQPRLFISYAHCDVDKLRKTLVPTLPKSFRNSKHSSTTWPFLVGNWIAYDSEEALNETNAALSREKNSALRPVANAFSTIKKNAFAAFSCLDKCDSKLFTQFERLAIGLVKSYLGAAICGSVAETQPEIRSQLARLRIQSALKGRRLAKRLGQDALIARFTELSAQAFYEANDLKRSVLYYQASARLYRVLNSKDTLKYSQSLATVLNNLGIVQCRLQKLQDGRDSLKEAQSLYETLCQSSSNRLSYLLAIASNNLANATLSLGDAGSAVSYLERALFLSKSLKTSRSSLNCRAWTLNNLGNAQRTANDFLNARLSLYKAVHLQRHFASESEGSYLFQRAASLSNLGSLLLQNGDHLEAQSYFKQALEILAPLENANNESNAIFPFAETNWKVLKRSLTPWVNPSLLKGMVCPRLHFFNCEDSFVEQSQLKAPPQMPSGRHPALIIFLVDQSGSMKEQWAQHSEVSKATAARDSLHECLDELATHSLHRNGFIDQTFIGIFGYKEQVPGQTVLREIFVGWPRNLKGRVREYDWTRDCGGRTSIATAFQETASLMEYFYADQFVQGRFTGSPSPIVINITDGISNDDFPLRKSVNQIRKVKTPTGLSPLVVSIQIASASEKRGDSDYLPKNDNHFECWEKELFDCSDSIPERMKLQLRFAFPDLALDEHRFGLFLNAGPSSFKQLLRILLGITISGSDQNVADGTEST